MKSRFSKKMIKLAYKYASEGNTNDEIAKNLGIHRATFYRWIEKYRDFGDAIKKGREQKANPEVENALYKSAVGYWVEEEKKIIFKSKDGKETIKVEKTKKWIPPNPTAQIFYLKNRISERWSDKQKLDISQEIHVIEDDIK